MPAYTIEIEHRERDQVFSYYHGDTMLHFNASLLARLHEQMPNEFRRITMDLGQAEYDLCMANRGIELPKLDALTAKQLRDPGYGVLFEAGTFSIVDGHHRLVRRYQGGARVMDFYVTHPAVWKHCLIDYAPEHEALLAGAMPPKVINPENLASCVAIHPQEYVA